MGQAKIVEVNVPNWESPKNKLKTNNRDKEVESGEYNDKANTGDEAENYKVKDSEKNTSASKRFKGEELVTQTRRISGHVNSDNHKCDAVSVSAEMKGSPTGRKEIPQPSKQSKSYKQHQSPKDREIDEEFSKTQSTRKQKEKRLLENTGKDLKADAGEKKPPFHKFLVCTMSRSPFSKVLLLVRVKLLLLVCFLRKKM